MVTVVVCGGSTVSLLTWFDIPLGVEDDEDDQVVVDQLQHRTPKTHSSSSFGYSREQRFTQYV